jgi:nucleoside-diphosphate-sugar epimerase
LTLPDAQIAGKIYNAGYQNHTVSDIAEMVRNVVGPQVDIVKTPTDDHRSYHISSEKIKRELNFTASHTIEDAVKDLKVAFERGLVPDSMTNPKYFNVKLMKMIDLQ